MSDGRELLAVMPLADRTNWVAWTPDGFYAATPGARSVLGWHVNDGWDHDAEFVPVSELPELYRPDLPPRVLRDLDTVRALGPGELDHARDAVQERTDSSRPGPRLHVLTVGIDDGGAAPQPQPQRLRYATADAGALALALDDQGQSQLYAEVDRQVLLNRYATLTGLDQALDALCAAMTSGEGRDVAVVMIAGRGRVLDGKFTLAPYYYSAASSVYEREDGDLLRHYAAMIGDRGRGLLLLDLSHSSTLDDDDARATPNAEAVRAALAAPNVAVVTATSGAQVSMENPGLKHGAFTTALLQALGPGADTDHNGRISVTELMNALSNTVPALTNGQQTPGIEAHLAGDLFVVTAPPGETAEGVAGRNR
jgi:hypothetical protein